MGSRVDMMKDTGDIFAILHNEDNAVGPSI